jgi:long-chain acyl-CoA synthetase
VREFAVPPVVTVSDGANLTDPVWDNAMSHPDKPQFARRTATGWSDVTCLQFRDQVVALARGFIAEGIQVGDRVALMSRTRYEWTLVDYAILAAGAVTVPIYETSSAEQMQWMLADSGAVAAVVETSAHTAHLAAIADTLPALTRIYQIEPGTVESGADESGAARGPAIPMLVEAGERGAPADEVERRRHARGADELATIIYTSGTTGRPKGCTLTHRNISADISNALPGLAELFAEGSSTLLFLPLAHSFARLIQFGVVQARVRTAHTPDTKNLVDDLQAFRPTFVLAVPRVFEKVYTSAKQQAQAGGKGAIFDRAERVAIAYSEARSTPRGPGLMLRAQHAVFDRLVYSRLRAALGGRCTSAISGGAPLGARLAHFFRGIGVTVYEGYGLTETSPAAAVNVPDHIRIGTVGRPLPGVAVRVDDSGELSIRGDLIFPGYWRNPEATAEVLDAEGWFHTGDLGSLDADGYLTITGRKKELIVTAGGKNVAPAVLEDRLRAHALISQCMVIGDRQPFIAALVTIDEEVFPTWKSAHGKPAGAGVADLRTDPDLVAAVQEAVDDANRAVSKAESIRVFRILASDFTEANGMLTPSLKVKRSVVAKEYADEIAAIYR